MKVCFNREFTKTELNCLLKLIDRNSFKKTIFNSPLSFKFNHITAKSHKSKNIFCVSKRLFSELLNQTQAKNIGNNSTNDNTTPNFDNVSNKDFIGDLDSECDPTKISIIKKTPASADINNSSLSGISGENGIKPLEDSDLILDPNSPTYLEDMKRLPRYIQHIEFHKHLMLKRKKAETKRLYNQRVLFALGILLIGLFAFWVPLYRVVCEHAGFSVKTTIADYKDYNKNVNLGRKFKVSFEALVDEDLAWEFYPEQKSVYINAGETCLIFYKAKNKTNKPIVGLSVYDVHPQSCALYFNKVQCFCFENQMLGPNEEVDFPVLFYLDPSIQEDKYVIDYGHFDLNLKYTFYYAKKQDLAKIMKKRLLEEKEFESELNKKKTDLNSKYGYEKYLIEENKSTLPGINPLLRDFKISEI